MTVPIYIYIYMIEMRVHDSSLWSHVDDPSLGSRHIGGSVLGLVLTWPALDQDIPCDAEIY